MARARGLAWTSRGPSRSNRSARTQTATLSAKNEGTIRDVRLREAQMNKSSRRSAITGARAIVVNCHYGTTPLWRNTAVVAHISRLSPVPVLALPSEGIALSNDGRVATSARSSLRSIQRLRPPLRCEPAWLSRLDTALV